MCVLKYLKATSQSENRKAFLPYDIWHVLNNKVLEYWVWNLVIQSHQTQTLWWILTKKQALINSHQTQILWYILTKHKHWYTFWPNTNIVIYSHQTQKVWYILTKLKHCNTFSPNSNIMIHSDQTQKIWSIIWDKIENTKWRLIFPPRHGAHYVIWSYKEWLAKGNHILSSSGPEQKMFNTYILNFLTIWLSPRFRT